MNTKSKSDVLNAYAQKLMDIGIEIISGARIKVGEKWARDPKVIALTILSRTLGNMKGAVIHGAGATACRNDGAYSVLL